MDYDNSNYYIGLEHATDQEELEKLSNASARDKASDTDSKLENLNYGSATAHGRKQMTKVMEEKDEYGNRIGNKLRLPELLAQEFEFGSNRSKGKIYFKTFEDVVEGAIETSRYFDAKGKPRGTKTRVKRNKKTGEPVLDKQTGKSVKETVWDIGEPSYAGGITSARELAIAIALKCVVDALHPHSNQSREWVPGAALICRIADQLFLQMAHAQAFQTDPKHLKSVEKFWAGANQAPKNRKTNQVKYQRKIVSADSYDELRRKFEKQGHHFFLAGHLVWLIAGVGNMIEPVWDSARKGEGNGLTRFRPTEAYIEGYEKVSEYLMKSALLPHPMIEVPHMWEPSDQGVTNTSGGFHSDAYRDKNPLVRRRYGESGTNASESIVGLLNKLQGTAFTADPEMIDAFRFVMHNRVKVPGVHHRPLHGVRELEIQSARRKAWINSQPEDQKPSEDDRAAWSKAQSNRFKVAVGEQKKYLRSLQNYQVLGFLEKLGPEKKLFYPWSADHRTRVYPLVGGITPQGTSAERRILRFADGCNVNDSLTTLQEVHRAIGSAFIGTKVSYNKRELWSRQNINGIVDALTGSSWDIDLSIIKNADEPWDALAYAREYQAHVLGDQPLWHVPMGMDATASGLQWLSGLRGDLKGLVNSNVIQVGEFGFGIDPIDGYTEVCLIAQRLVSGQQNAAKLAGEEWAEKHQYHPLVMAKIRRILNGGYARALNKCVAMPQWYGCGSGTTKDNINEFLLVEMNLDPMRLFEGESGWKLGLDLVNGLSDYIRMALKIVYPSAMETLAWLKSLARKSINNQLRRKPDKMPVLAWQMHDGQFVSYWENERQFKSVEVSGIGKLKTPVGAKDDVDPDLRAMRDAFAPNLVHSYDSALLRVIAKDWEGPINMIHDQIDCLPSDVVKLRDAIQDGFREVIEKNPLSNLPAMLQTPRSRCIPCVPGLITEDNMSPYIFN